jgi:hypothetical protein
MRIKESPCFSRNSALVRDKSLSTPEAECSGFSPVRDLAEARGHQCRKREHFTGKILLFRGEWHSIWGMSKKIVEKRVVLLRQTGHELPQ